MMSNSIDFKFRPQSYFWAKERGIALSSDIKGANRRRIYELSLERDEAGELSPAFSQHALVEEDRRLLGRLHPSFMGGEYLPNTKAQEVEIARITIASTTRDVTCVYAKPIGKRIYYRIVDEYNGDTVNGRAFRTSTAPLTLAVLLDFFLNGWNLLDCLDFNFADQHYPRDEVHAFVVEASSSFYGQFGAAIEAKVDAWLDEKHANDPPELLDDEDPNEYGLAGSGTLDLMNLPFDPAEAAAKASQRRRKRT
jgi:hypothetical protein